MNLPFFPHFCPRGSALAVAACLLGSLFVVPRTGAEISPPTFDPATGIIRDATRAVPLPDGKILACRIVRGTATETVLVRLNADGSVDSTFSAGDPGLSAYSLILPLGNGQTLVTVDPGASGGSASSLVWLRLNADGSLDKGFQAAYGYPAGSEAVHLADGKILLPINTDDGTKLVRLNTDGTVDASFSAAEPVERSFRLDGNGDILLLKDVATDGDSDTSVLVRLDPDGAFKANIPLLPGLPDAYADAFLPLPDGKIAVALSYSDDNDFDVTRVFRLNADGTPDATFDSSAVFDGPAKELIAVHAGLLVYGFFDQVDGASRRGFARLGGDGRLDPAYGSPVGDGDGVEDVLPLPGGDIHAITTTSEGVDGQAALVSSAHVRFDSEGVLAASQSLDPLYGYSLIPNASGNGAYVVGSAASDLPFPSVENADAGGIIHPPPASGGGVIRGAHRPAVMVTAARPRIYSGSGTPGKFIVRRGDADISKPLRIVYRVEGSAVAGRDYRALRRVRVIPAGQRIARIPVRPVGEAFGKPEGGQASVAIRLLPRKDYRLGPQRRAKVKLIDRAALTGPQG